MADHGGPRHQRAGSWRPRAPARAEAEAPGLLPPARSPRPPRVRVQAWLEEGETVPSIIDVWPTADWHEREAWDADGHRVRGPPEPGAHPHGRRLSKSPAPQGLPDRRRPVRFSEEALRPVAHAIWLTAPPPSPLMATRATQFEPQSTRGRGFRRRFRPCSMSLPTTCATGRRPPGQLRAEPPVRRTASSA